MDYRIIDGFDHLNIDEVVKLLMMPSIRNRYTRKLRFQMPTPYQE